MLITVITVTDLPGPGRPACCFQAETVVPACAVASDPAEGALSSLCLPDAGGNRHQHVLKRVVIKS